MAVHLDRTRSKGELGPSRSDSCCPSVGVSGGEIWGSAADPRALAGDALLDQTMMSDMKGGPGTII